MRSAARPLPPRLKWLRRLAVLAILQIPHAEREMGEAVRRILRGQTLGRAEGFRHGPVGQERDEGPLQKLGVLRVVLQGFTIERRRRCGVAGGAGDVSGQIVALKGFSRIERPRRRGRRRWAARGDRGRSDQARKDQRERRTAEKRRQAS